MDDVHRDEEDEEHAKNRYPTLDIGSHINARPEPLPEAGAQRRLEAIGSMPLFGGRLQPATHRSLVGQVVRREASLQVVLLSRNDHERHQPHRWHEGDEEPETVDPEGDAELE
jgi:hypothetical protein